MIAVEFVVVVLNVVISRSSSTHRATNTIRESRVRLGAKREGSFWWWGGGVCILVLVC